MGYSYKQLNKVLLVYVKIIKKLFTNEKIKILSQNKYIKEVSKKCITYNDEFKSIYIINSK